MVCLLILSWLQANADVARLAAERDEALAEVGRLMDQMRKATPQTTQWVSNNINSSLCVDGCVCWCGMLMRVFAMKCWRRSAA